MCKSQINNSFSVPNQTSKNNATESVNPSKEDKSKQEFINKMDQDYKKLKPKTKKSKRKSSRRGRGATIQETIKG